MKKFVVSKTTVLNRSTKDNSILEESSDEIKSFDNPVEARAFLATVALPLQTPEADLYKEVIEIDEDGE